MRRLTNTYGALSNLLGIIRQWVRKADAYLLRPMYLRCREVAFEQKGKFRIDCIKSAPAFEALCQEFYIPLNASRVKTAGAFCRWYMHSRFRWIINVSVHRGAICLPPMQCSASADLSAKDLMNLILGSAKLWANTERTATKEQLEDNTATPNSSKRDVGLEDRSQEKSRLTFSEAARRQYAKEKEDTLILKARITNLADFIGPPAEDVEQYVISRFSEANGFSVDIQALNDNIRKDFNIMWAASVVDSINERYWNILKESLISQDEIRYYTTKEKLKSISHE